MLLISISVLVDVFLLVFSGDSRCHEPDAGGGKGWVCNWEPQRGGGPVFRRGLFVHRLPGDGRIEEVILHYKSNLL